MAQKLSTIIAGIRQRLSDEYAAGTAQKWADDELRILADDCLKEFSDYRPYESRETLHTTASSRDLSLAAIDGLIRVVRVEYPVDEYPANMIAFEVFGTMLTLKVSGAPAAADEHVYAYCHKVHTLTDTTSTLNPVLERLLVLGVAGQAAINRAQLLIDKVNIGGTSTPSQLQAWGDTQIGLFREGLRQPNKVRVSYLYPEG